MSTAAPPRLGRSGLLILVALLLLAAAAWVVLVDQAQIHGGMGQGDSMSAMEMAAPAPMTDAPASGLTMGMGAALFIGLWGLMMVAIMLPSASPMILMFDRVQRHRAERGRPVVATWIFAAAYIAVWIATGVIAYAVAVGVDALAGDSMWLSENGVRIGGALILAAGVYQLTPLKQVCLDKCRSPFAFISSSWREGVGGALRMGVSHAAYCIGCCWLLFLILFPLGMMNVVAMAVIAALILAEKVLPFGNAVRYVAAAVLIGYGAAVIVWPSALPTMA